jgi:hypothetical protein
MNYQLFVLHGSSFFPSAVLELCLGKLREISAKPERKSLFLRLCIMKVRSCGLQHRTRPDAVNLTPAYPQGITATVRDTALGQNLTAGGNADTTLGQNLASQTTHDTTLGHFGRQCGTTPHSAKTSLQTTQQATTPHSAKTSHATRLRQSLTSPDNAAQLRHRTRPKPAADKAAQLRHRGQNLTSADNATPHRSKPHFGRQCDIALGQNLTSPDNATQLRHRTRPKTSLGQTTQHSYDTALGQKPHFGRQRNTATTPKTSLRQTM